MNINSGLISFVGSYPLESVIIYRPEGRGGGGGKGGFGCVIINVSDPLWPCSILMIPPSPPPSLAVNFQ